MGGYRVGERERRKGGEGKEKNKDVGDNTCCTHTHTSGREESFCNRSYKVVYTAIIIIPKMI